MISSRAVEEVVLQWFNDNLFQKHLERYLKLWVTELILSWYDRSAYGRCSARMPKYADAPWGCPISSIVDLDPCSLEETVKRPFPNQNIVGITTDGGEQNFILTYLDSRMSYHILFLLTDMPLWDWDANNLQIYIDTIMNIAWLWPAACLSPLVRYIQYTIARRELWYQARPQGVTQYMFFMY